MKNKIMLGAAMICIVVIMLSLVSAIKITSVSSSPSTVEPGKKVTLSIGVKNDLDDDIKNVGLILNLQGLPIAPASNAASSVFTNKMDSDDSETFTFNLVVDAEADSKVYTIPVSVVYQIDSGSNQTVSQPLSVVSITVNSKPVLSLSSESILIQGQKNKLQVQITNKGLAKAKFLSINLGSGSYSLLSSSNAYIGDLNSNDFDSASFDIYSSGAGTVLFPVTVTYKDSANTDFAENLNLEMKVYSQEEALRLGLITKSKTGTYVSVVVILIILWIVYSRLRKWYKKRKNKMEEEK